MRNLSLLNPILKIIFMLSLVMQTAYLSINPPEVRIMVVGDIMMHTPVIYAGYEDGTNEYDFSNMFTDMKPIFDEADLVIGNLETPLAGKEKGYSGYPRFNAPDELAFALKEAGFDVLTTANNHSMDKNADGVVHTLDVLDANNLIHTGTFRSQEEKDKSLIIEVDGIKLGLISYTYGTNGLPVPEDKPYMVNLLDLESIEEDVTRLKNNDVDYILAMIHFGYEYHRTQSEEQEKWTNDLFDLGVDFVLGSHPHVVQPMQKIVGQNNTSDKGVIYSLGNFLSNQRGDWKDYGVLLDIVLEKDVRNDKVVIKDLSVISTYVDIYRENGKREYLVVPIIEGNDELDTQIVQNGEELVEHVFNYNFEDDSSEVEYY